VAQDSQAVAFSVSKRDRKRLDRIVKRYGHGNRSEALRVMIDRLEASERAQQLRSLQAYGAQKSAERGLNFDDAQAIVHRVRERRKRVAHA
jgi:metal-responsive CopG/Arc/MetJ family transcriptional regulator